MIIRSEGFLISYENFHLIYLKNVEYLVWLEFISKTILRWSDHGIPSTNIN